MKVGDLVKFKSSAPRHAGKVFLLAWKNENGWAKLIGDIHYDRFGATRVKALEMVQAA